jgi:hypothetical protein
MMELENRSGQLRAQSRISSRNSVLRLGLREAQGPTPEEEEAMRELARYDEQLWDQAQAARKSHVLVLGAEM